MNKQDLEKLGIDEEIAKQIIILHGKDIEHLKADLEAKAGEVEQLNSQLVEAGKAIEGFKELDVEGIKAAAEEWKTKAEQAQAEAEQKVQALRFEHALKEALGAVKAKNSKAVKALLDLDSVKFSENGEQLEGLEEQLAAIKEENSYLFEDSESAAEKEKEEEDYFGPKIVTKTENKGVLGDSVLSAVRKAAGLPDD